MTRILRRGIALPGVLATLLLVAACSGDPEARKQQFLESGDRYFAENKFREAVVEYKNAVQIDARFAPARRGLAAAYEKLGDAPNAFAEYVRAADLLPDDLAIQLTAGSYLLAARRFEDAKSKAELVLGREPKNVQGQVLLGNSLAGLRNIDQAIAEIEEAIRIDPLRGATYTNLGILELGRGRASAAEGAFQRSVELEPKWVPGHLALANHYWSTGRADEAERVLRTALGLEPANTLTNRALALFLISRNRVSEAEPFVRALTASGAAPFALADLYLLQNRTGDAIPELQQLRTKADTALGAAHRLAQAYALRGDFADAHRVVDELLAGSPGDAASLLLKGQLLAREGKRDEALVQFQAASQADPNSAPVQFALGRTLAARGDLDGARQAYLEVVRLNPRAAGAQVELARLELLSGKVDSSLQMAREAVKSDPGSRDAQLALARGLTAKGDVAGAEKVLNSLRDKNENLPGLHVERARVLAAQKNVAGARQAYERALALDAASVEALGGLITLDLAAGDAAAARARIDAAVRAFPDRPELLLVAGRTYAASQDLQGAERLLRRAVEMQPALLPGYIMLGQLYFAQQRLDDARREFETLAARQPKPVAALTMLGMIAQIQKDEKTAEQYYERAVGVEPRAPIAANNLAWMYADRGERLDTALRLARLATEQLPQIPEVHDTLGWVYYKQQSSERAIEAFRTAVKLAPRNPTTHYHLALAYQQAGDLRSAQTAVQQALALSATFAEASDARSLLKTLSQAGGSPQ